VGVSSFELAVELLPLLDTIRGDLRVADGFRASMDVTGKGTVDYASPSAKRARLAEYFAGVSHFVSGEKMQIAAQDLAADLQAKADSMFIHLRQNEWIRNAEGFGWFNGYYDNDGNRLEGDHPLGVRMTLTGQVFSLMGGSATGEQSQAILRAVDRYLFDPAIGGHRLNTDFKEVLPKMGRCFGFAFGHKENGAMFSHMAVMYAYALYERGFARAGFHVLETIYRHCVDFPTSRMYPGIPEYMSSRGRGMYPYLTGSASWYLLTLVTRAYGVRGMKGDLCLAPKLVREEFGSSGKTSVTTLFAGKILRVVYDNSDKLDVGQYQVDEVILDGRKIDFQRKTDGVIIPRTMIIALEPDATHILTVTLKKCHGEFSPRPAGVMG
jgi:cellobiose phosphorylase